MKLKFFGGTAQIGEEFVFQIEVHDGDDNVLQKFTSTKTFSKRDDAEKAMQITVEKFKLKLRNDFEHIH